MYSLTYYIIEIIPFILIKCR